MSFFISIYYFRMLGTGRVNNVFSPKIFVSKKMITNMKLQPSKLGLRSRGNLQLLRQIAVVHFCCLKNLNKYMCSDQDVLTLSILFIVYKIFRGE